MARGRLWNRDELIRALALYYQIPFGSIDGRNPAIQALAGELDRSVGSVALKLANFASLDPTIRQSGRRGMVNASTLDRSIFKEFARRWFELSVVLPDAVLSTLDPVAEVDASLPEQFLIREGPTEIPRTSWVRRGQDFFRRSVLAAYRETCCITGIADPRFLRAGHIIPWRDAESLRLDPQNGLCLNSLHDNAFDQGLLTLDEQHRVVLSRDLAGKIPPDVYRRFFSVYEGSTIQVPDRLPPLDSALEYHRSNVFHE
jgi:putative restriction endonuclease